MKALLTIILTVFAITVNAETASNTKPNPALEKKLETYQGFLDLTYKECLKRETKETAKSVIKFCEKTNKALTQKKMVEPGQLFYLFMLAMDADSYEEKRKTSAIIMQTLLDN